ncbi:MAG TPA: trypsin-like peptidase domain-containing protein [Thermoanaerobaculia bacterium]|nr:trypsin-like peptidase domain-containing protein [Thermoanaerobaculia bacterium]
MSVRARLLILFALLAIACRRDQSRLDEVGKMAYTVKPAVVRVNAYATGQFRYTPSTISDVEAQLHTDGFDFAARALPANETALDTGAGGSGSGFIINPDGVIVTCGHVVSPTRDDAALRRELLRNGAIATLLRHFPVENLRSIHRGDGLDRYINYVATAGQLQNVRVVNEVELSNGEKLPFRIKSYSPPLNERGTDLAVLQIDRRNLPAIRLADSDTARVGDSIWAVGYPAVASSSDDVIGGWLSRDSDLEATVSPGNVTAIKRNIANVPVLQSNVAIYRGNSGGPVVNRDGEVIGISTWGHTDAEQIKFLVPSNVAREMLQASKVAINADGEMGRHYRAALDAAADGDWSKASSEVAVASAMFKGSPDLIRFRHDAERALKTLPPWRLHPIASGVVAAFVGAFVIGGTLLLTRSRTKIPLPPEVAGTVETVLPNEGGLATRMLGRFTILNGSRAGQRLGLGGSGIRIGRESTICEIVLENPKVSRLHAEVVSIDGKVMLIDRNSSNGTYVNDQKIDKRFLKDGDIIYFGGRNAVAVAYHA